MLKGYRYKLNPTKSQAEFFDKSFGCARFVYNWALEKRISSYTESKIQLSFFDLCKELVLLKKNEDTSWLNDVSAQSLLYSVRNVDNAFSMFFNKKSKFPKYKSKHCCRQSFQYATKVKINFSNHKIRLPKVGWVKFFKSREFIGMIKTTTVVKKSSGKYFVSILVDDCMSMPNKPEIEEKDSIGIDVGIKNFAVLSNGEIIDNPKYFEKDEQKIKVLQRRLSRKLRDSKRYEKARIALAKQYEKVTNKRMDFLHKLTSRIVRENQTIIIEDLNVEGMLKNHNLAKHISSVSWYEFFRQLRYKCDWYGKNLIKIGRFEPSSKMCECGYINKDLKLSDREWDCPVCGRHNDRDLLAARNIKRFGLAKISPGGTGKECVELRGDSDDEAQMFTKNNGNNSK